MRLTLFVLLMILPGLTLADELKCYSEGKLIYSGIGSLDNIQDGLFSFIESKSGKLVLITADCIAKVKV